MKEFKTYYRSEIGLIEIAGTEDGIHSVNFVEEKSTSTPEIPSCLKECVRQLDEYFKGKRKEFSLKMKLGGTDFQKKVWRELMRIPFGKTVSYKDIAEAIGKKEATRAVGMANNRNPIGIIIPCHRVIGSDGKLVGYGGGLWRKEWLINHERKVSSGDLMKLI